MNYSIITPVRNEEKFIKKTIISVLNQDHLPDKWLIINDNSTDNSASIINSYAQEHNFIDNGFFGASLIAYDDLMNKKDFKLIAIDSSGTNAFFVKSKFSYLFEVLDPIKSFKSVGRLYSEEQKKNI